MGFLRKKAMLLLALACLAGAGALIMYRQGPTGGSRPEAPGAIPRPGAAGAAATTATLAGPGPAAPGSAAAPAATPVPASARTKADGSAPAAPGQAAADLTRSGQAPPAGYGGFFTGPERDRVRKATDAMADPRLAPAVRAFFKESLRDRRLGRLVRNNLAEALHRQEPPDPSLHREFLAVLDDASEVPDWKLYSIQHLAFTLRYSPKSEPEIRERLFREAREGAPESSAQALTMLDIAQREGWTAAAGLDELAALKLSSPSADERTAALALAGRRGLAAQAGRVRELARTAGPGQRHAVAALGGVGDASDRDFLRGLSAGGDKLVSAAAAGALKRLEARAGAVASAGRP